jgi:hypothetical protein
MVFGSYLCICTHLYLKDDNTLLLYKEGDNGFFFEVCSIWTYQFIKCLEVLCVNQNQYTNILLIFFKVAIVNM